MSSLFIDVTTLPDGPYGFAQLMFLFVAYGYVLMVSSGMISDGSELLLLVPSLAGVVGSIVLPVLGAVPDGAIVLFSGMGPNAQSQLSVGVGALAGSTIMLLTIPWCLSVLAGRVNVNNDGSTNYRGRPKLAPENEFSLTKSGVGLGHNVHVGAWIMIGTSLTYLILQGPGVFFLGETDAEVARHESLWSLGGLIICLGLFVMYLWYQFKVAHSEDQTNTFNELRSRVVSDAIEMGEISLFGAMSEELEAGIKNRPSETSSLVNKDASVGRLERVLRPFFSKYDRDRNGSLSTDELSLIFKDMGENLPVAVLNNRFKKFDKDGSGSIDFAEFVEGTYDLLSNSAEIRSLYAAKGVLNRTASMESSPSKDRKEDEEDEEEEEEMPEEFAALSPEEQQYRIKIRSAYMMGLGTFLVLLFSDPMVDVLNEIGVRLNINPFYVAFVLGPLASNASELIASFNYAAKKTPKSISISLATLEGAACMNNTFGLSIFMYLIYAQGLAWEYLAETFVILFVQICVGIFAIIKNTHTPLDALLILSLYPLSMIICAGLEHIGWN